MLLFHVTNFNNFTKIKKTKILKPRYSKKGNHPTLISNKNLIYFHLNFEVNLNYLESSSLEFKKKGTPDKYIQIKIDVSKKILTQLKINLKYDEDNFFNNIYNQDNYLYGELTNIPEKDELINLLKYKPFKNSTKIKYSKNRNIINNIMTTHPKLFKSFNKKNPMKSICVEGQLNLNFLNKVKYREIEITADYFYLKIDKIGRWKYF